MQFLKTLLIVLAVGVAVAFAFNNWTSVDVRLWGGLIVDINLPLLMLACFLAGLIPTWLWQRALRWRAQQRLAANERTLADLRAAVAATAPPPPATAIVTEPQPLPAAPPLIDDARP